MTKHRRKRHYRKIAIAAVAISAVAVPSAAMACLDGEGNTDGRGPGRWQSPASTQTTKISKAAAPSPNTSESAAPASKATARVLELVNSERGKAGCAPLKLNTKLTKAAQDHSEDMAEHRDMSHTGSDGSAPEERITRAGYQWSSYGENVAYGYSTPESVMEGWMTSPGHKRNILDCSFKEIGVGLAQPGDYWTQDFGTAG
ncbi:CAP domain-containing protein [Streptomyces sp. NPDC001339]|uniref:CAP domain-containing protein n=1 Tax=Streptomyces sp. NPDC001339 TaxID=3364563 RepID=UPI0036CCAED3